MLNEQELQVKHRWINLKEKRDEQTIIPHRFVIESIDTIDSKSRSLVISVSRKFRPVCTSDGKYFIPHYEEDNERFSVNENKWDNKKFKDVSRIMAFLVHDQKTYKNPDGSDKEYTVCYLDRFMGILETEVWRFHEEMDIP